MGRYDDLTDKARAAHEIRVQQALADHKLNHAQHRVQDQNQDQDQERVRERVREGTPPENPKRGPADDDYDRDAIMLENRALKRRAEMLLERHRTQFPSRKL